MIKKIFTLLCLCTLCIGSAWGAEKTLVIDGSTLTSTATTADADYTYGDFTICMSKGAKKQAVQTSANNEFEEGDAILIGKSGAYIYNKTPFGKITKFEIYANAGASTKVSVGVLFSTTTISAYATGTNTYTATLSTSDNVYDCSSKIPEGAKYFWYQVTNANNSQVQFRITYEEATPTSVYTVTLSDNEAKLKTDINGKVTLPKRVSADSEFNTFVGWAKAAINEATATAPELFNGEYTPAGDITLYPIFKKETQGEIGWTEVTQLSKITAGIYAIITTDGHAFNGNINSSGHGDVTTSAFSFTNGSATSAPEGTCEITITTSDEGFAMYHEGKGFLYAKEAKSGNLAWHSSESSYWLNKSSNWTYNSNSAYLRSYNNSSIRTYGTNNGEVLKFAKKGAAIISEFKTVNSAFEYTRELTVGNYGTMCLPCSANISGAEVYSVEGVDSKVTPTILYLTKVDGETVAGVPYIIRATGNKLVASYTGEPTEDAGNENGLYGSFISAPIEAGKLNYILKDNTWHYIPAGNTNTVGAYKAYLNLNYVEVISSGAKGDFEMVFDGNVTSINLVPTTEEIGGAMYNLNGMQVNANYKGIVVKNGKKFINK